MKMPERMRSFGELVMRHRGQRICVMGGGPTLATDLESVEADVWISVNEHGAKLRPVDYVVAMDNLHTKINVQMKDHIRPHTDAPIIGPWHWNDWQLTRWPGMPAMPLSGVVATWLAYLLGGHPVIMAGFDCYGGRKVGQHKEMAPHVRAEVRVVSGPLVGLYKQYDPLETFPPFEAPDVMKLIPELDGEIKVRVRKAVSVRGHEWPVGSELVIPRHEVHLQLKHKSLVEIEMDKPLPTVLETPAVELETDAPTVIKRKAGRPKKVVDHAD